MYLQRFVIQYLPICHVLFSFLFSFLYYILIESVFPLSTHYNLLRIEKKLKYNQGET